MEDVAVELSAVVVAVTGGEPRVLTVGDGNALPEGPFESSHRTLELGLRAWVQSSAGHSLGYVEQLYTFADKNRILSSGRRLISLSYLALARETPAASGGVRWSPWDWYFPWEDWRRPEGQEAAQSLGEQLLVWARTAPDAATAAVRRQRAISTFGLEGVAWNEELALQRYELLYEAGLVAEAMRDAKDMGMAAPGSGMPMAWDHRRILATAISRLRAKIKYRPVVFELLPPSFTRLQLQQTVEALAGHSVHKQNFRRLIDQQGLIEDTGQIASDTGGRPARLARFRPDVLLERAVAGTRPAMLRMR
jgi:hypothetical protein